MYHLPKIYDYNPDMKIVLILRDPIEYAVSRYIHLARKGQVSTAEITELLRQDSVLNLNWTTSPWWDGIDNLTSRVTC